MWWGLVIILIIVSGWCITRAKIHNTGRAVLVTGGRAPCALEVARMFTTQGWRVIMAESVSFPISGPSRFVQRVYSVPPPNTQPTQYVSALIEIIKKEKVELLIPTCEEVFWVSRGKPLLEHYCKVFCEDLSKLKNLHSKWLFFVTASNHGLRVPPTKALTSRIGLENVAADIGASNSDTKINGGGGYERGWKNVVLKPEFSRFATKTIILPRTWDDLKGASKDLDMQVMWVAQQYIHGTHFCTYSVAYNGKLLAHSTYQLDFAAKSKNGVGAAVAFEHVQNDQAQNWVKTFVEKENLTGHMAFDFIQDSNGDLYALECNPRATSGVHLFATSDQRENYVKCIADGELDCPTPITPTNHTPVMITLAMLIYALPQCSSMVELKKWWRTVRRCKDAVFRWNDPMPFLLQSSGILVFIIISFKHSISLMEATTFDIEWNGQT